MADERDRRPFHEVPRDPTERELAEHPEWRGTLPGGRGMVLVEKHSGDARDCRFPPCLVNRAGVDTDPDDRRAPVLPDIRSHRHAENPWECPPGCPKREAERQRFLEPARSLVGPSIELAKALQREPFAPAVMRGMRAAGYTEAELDQLADRLATDILNRDRPEPASPKFISLSRALAGLRETMAHEQHRRMTWGEIEAFLTGWLADDLPLDEIDALFRPRP